MTNQVKVKQTEKYKDSQGEHIVYKGKLIFIYPKVGRNMMHNERGYFQPIIISETEKIELNDWCIMFDDFGNVFSQPQQWLGIGVLNKGLRKILAFPEHFSPKQLQAIVDSKLKDGDEVYVECDERYMVTLSGHRYVNIVKLTNNQIKLFPVKQENWHDRLAKYQEESRRNPTILANWLDEHYPIK